MADMAGSSSSGSGSSALVPPPGAPPPHDSLSLFRTALAPPDAATEQYCFEALYSHFYAQPHNLQGFMQPLASVFGQASDRYRVWISRILDLAFNRPGLSVDARMVVAPHIPDVVLFFLHAPLGQWAAQAKVAATAFASVYPLLVRQLAAMPAQASISAPLSQSLPAIKARIAHLFDAQDTPVGVKIALVKAMQRIVQVQTRLSSDPRAAAAAGAAAASPLETSLSEIPANHPNPALNTRALEAESNAILTQLITAQYTSADPDLLMALINALGVLAKLRQPLVKIVIESMLSWTPAALNGAEKPATQIRNVEKTLRLLLFHFLRSPLPTITPYHTRLAAALESQKARMEQAARAYASAREAEARRKRDALAAEMERADGSGPSSSKRAKTTSSTAPGAAGSSGAGAGAAGATASQASQSTGTSGPPTEEALAAAQRLRRAAADWCASQTRGGAQNMLASFDVKALQLNLVIDCVLANLGAVNVTELDNAISHIRGYLRRAEAEEARQRPAPSASTSTAVAESGPIDPLKVDLEADEALEKLSPVEAGLIDEEEDGARASGSRSTPASGSRRHASSAVATTAPGELVAFEGFTLPPPDRLAAVEGRRMLTDAVQRICEVGASVGTIDPSAALVGAGAAQVGRVADGEPSLAAGSDALTGGGGATMLGGLQDLWTMLVTRLATRGFSQWSMRPDPGAGSEESKELANGVVAAADEGPAGDLPNGHDDPSTSRASGSTSAASNNDAVEHGNRPSTSKALAASSSSTDKTLDDHANSVRGMILNLVKADFPNRVSFAVRWLTEEWTVEWRQYKLSSSGKGKAPRRGDDSHDADEDDYSTGPAVPTPTYDRWVLTLLDEVVPTLQDKDKSLSRFLSDLPSLPHAALSKVEPLCHDKGRMIIGFTALREIAAHRPPARAEALRILLGLTRHREEAVRKAAINTCRSWVKSGGGPPGKAGGGAGEGSSAEHVSAGSGVNYKRGIERRVIEYGQASLEVLGRVREPKKDEEGIAETGASVPGAEQAEAASGAAASGGGEQAPEPSETTAPQAGEGEATQETVPNGETREPEQEHQPGPEDEVTTEADVQRFVELPFALSTKVPSLLTLVFDTYPRCPDFVKRAIEKHIYKLIKALGPSHARLLELIRTHPAGSESLALVVFRTLTETGRPPALIAIAKELAEEREIDPRFLVPIMPDMDKADIMRFLPRVVTLLGSGNPEDTQLVADVFHAIVVQPPATFGHVSSNLPRVRQTELLTPVELMSLLHYLPTEGSSTALKCAMEAIKICFGMTDIFRSEVLGAVLNQLADEPQVPILFMRTAIMAVSTYRSLTGYVGTNVLSSLITKKIWQTPVLWQGFIRCAQHTAPQSYGALIQLPLDQLKDVAVKSAQLKQGLKEYLLQRGGAGAQGAGRMRAFAAALGIDLEGESGGGGGGGGGGAPAGGAGGGNVSSGGGGVGSPHGGSDGAYTPMRQ